MQRWEYLTIDIGQDEEGRDFIKRPTKTLRGDEIWEFLSDEVGWLGWELVSVSITDHEGKHIQRLWFKKSLTDDPQPPYGGEPLSGNPSEIEVGP